MEVYDISGHPRDLEWVRETYGVEIENPPGLAAGEQYFQIRILREDEGPCAMIANVYSDDPGPMEGVLVAFYWADAPSPPESGEAPPTEVYPHDWYPNFVYGPTNAEGHWGTGMGQGAMVNVGGPGPHSVWVHHPQYRSAIVRGLGWLTGTNHRTLRLTFYLTENTAPTPPEPPTPPTPPTPPEPPDDYRSILDIANDLEGAFNALLPSLESLADDVAAIRALIRELKGRIYG